jgi:hypothetical protein
MFSFKVICECGFATEDGVWGATSLFDQSRIGIPVYLPSQGILLTRWIDCASLGVPVDQWVKENADRVIAEEYGKDALRLPLNPIDSPVFCPRCQKRSGKVIVSGIF